MFQTTNLMKMDEHGPYTDDFPIEKSWKLWLSTSMFTYLLIENTVVELCQFKGGWLFTSQWFPEPHPTPPIWVGEIPTKATDFEVCICKAHTIHYTEVWFLDWFTWFNRCTPRMVIQPTFANTSSGMLPCEGRSSNHLCWFISPKTMCLDHLIKHLY